MAKDIPIFNLEKIPDSALISLLRVELGKAESYIQELEYELDLYKKKDYQAIRDKLLKEKDRQIEQLKQKLAKQERKHKKDYSRVLNQYLTLKNKDNESK